jgi:hypothetical protein
LCFAVLIELFALYAKPFLKTGNGISTEKDHLEKQPVNAFPKRIALCKQEPHNILWINKKFTFFLFELSFSCASLNVSEAQRGGRI